MNSYNEFKNIIAKRLIGKKVNRTKIIHIQFKRYGSKILVLVVLYNASYCFSIVRFSPTLNEIIFNDMINNAISIVLQKTKNEAIEYNYTAYLALKRQLKGKCLDVRVMGDIDIVNALQIFLRNTRLNSGDRILWVDYCVKGRDIEFEVITSNGEILLSLFEIRNVKFEYEKFSEFISFVKQNFKRKKKQILSFLKY